MCAEFDVRLSQKEIETAFGHDLVNQSGEIVWEKRVKLTDSAPIIHVNAGKFLSSAIFPAHPFPNARLSSREDEQIRRIYEKPTWSKAFAQHRCLAVIS